MTDTDFERVIQQHTQPLVNYALSRGYARTRPDAEDLVQDLVLKLLRSRAYRRFRGESTPFVWLCAVLRSVKMRELEKQNATRRQEDRVGYQQTRAESSDAQHTRRLVEALIDDVQDATTRRALELYLLGVSWPEISKAVGQSRRTLERSVKHELGQQRE